MAMTPALARQILAAKKFAYRQRNIRESMLLGGCLAGAAGSLAVFGSGASDPVGGVVSVGMIAGLGVAFALSWLFRSRLFGAKCPQCGHDWEARRGRHIALSDYLEHWQRCRGCGVVMQDDYLRAVAEGRVPPEAPPEHPQRVSLSGELTQRVPDSLLRLVRLATLLGLAFALAIVLSFVVVAIMGMFGIAFAQAYNGWTFAACYLIALLLLWPRYRRWRMGDRFPSRPALLRVVLMIGLGAMLVAGAAATLVTVLFLEEPPILGAVVPLLVMGGLGACAIRIGLHVWRARREGRTL